MKSLNAAVNQACVNCVCVHKENNELCMIGYLHNSSNRCQDPNKLKAKTELRTDETLFRTGNRIKKKKKRKTKKKCKKGEKKGEQKGKKREENKKEKKKTKSKNKKKEKKGKKKRTMKRTLLCTCAVFLSTPFLSQTQVRWEDNHKCSHRNYDNG